MGHVDVEKCARRPRPASKPAHNTKLFTKILSKQMPETLHGRVLSKELKPASQVCTAHSSSMSGAVLRSLCPRRTGLMEFLQTEGGFKAPGDELPSVAGWVG